MATGRVCSVAQCPWGVCHLLCEHPLLPGLLWHCSGSQASLYPCRPFCGVLQLFLFFSKWLCKAMFLSSLCCFLSYAPPSSIVQTLILPNSSGVFLIFLLSWELQHRVVVGKKILDFIFSSVLLFCPQTCKTSYFDTLRDGSPDYFFKLRVLFICSFNSYNIGGVSSF